MIGNWTVAALYGYKVSEVDNPLIITNEDKKGGEGPIGAPSMVFI